MSYIGLVLTRACPTWAHAEREEWCGRCMGKEYIVRTHLSTWDKKHACEHIPETAREHPRWHLLTLLSSTLSRDKGMEQRVLPRSVVCTHMRDGPFSPKGPRTRSVYRVSLEACSRHLDEVLLCVRSLQLFYGYIADAYVCMYVCF